MSTSLQPPEPLSVIESAVASVVPHAVPEASVPADLLERSTAIHPAPVIPNLQALTQGSDERTRDRIRQAFRWACGLDVAVRKPGNVSLASAGHGMTAGQFLDSAAAAAGPLTSTGASVGRRIEGAVEASWSAAGCNTNLGIVLLCAPLATAAELLLRDLAQDHAEGLVVGSHPAPAGSPDADDDDPAAGAAPDRVGDAAPATADLGQRARQLQSVLQQVLATLDVDDAAATFRAITRANPGGLGDDARQDVRAAPTVNLRAAMVLAAPRDRIARQYQDCFGEVFELGLPAFLRALGTERLWPAVHPAGLPSLSPPLENAVQRCYLLWLASGLDSHLVRKHGHDVAHSVTVQARGWRMRLPEPLHGPESREWARWDDLLKSRRLNPGTSADLTVVTAFVAALLTLI